VAGAFELEPYRRCGPYDRSLSFAEARDRLGDRAEPFRKSPDSTFETLSVRDGHYHLFFDDEGSCDGIEVFLPDGVQITYRGVNLLLAETGWLSSALDSLGLGWELDTYGLRCRRLGIATFHPDFDVDAGHGPIDAVYASFDPSFVP